MRKGKKWMRKENKKKVGKDWRKEAWREENKNEHIA
jgi:hypothetical protein